MALNNLILDGTTAAGFEPVRQQFEHLMSTLDERNAQLCVYVGDDKVVDLWASATGDNSFSADSLVNVFSSGKSLETIAIASLVGKGLLNYEDPIANYWPEFAANGKATLTVADLMRHEAGMAALDVSLDPKHLHRDALRQNHVGKVIENHPVKFRTGDGSQREYHAITRGWIANELYRRVDPLGRTIGEFLEQDISGPLEADALIGVPADALSRVSDVAAVNPGRHILQSMKPSGRRVGHNFFQLSRRLLPMIPGARHRTTKGTPVPFIGMDSVNMFNADEVRMGETPSANAHCSARGLAKIAAMMANGGHWQGREYMAPSAWDALHAEPVERSMGFRTSFTQGGLAAFPQQPSRQSTLSNAFEAGREGYYGWMGLGGSIFQWNPSQRIGFAFVPTSLHVLDLVNERGKVFQQAVTRCL